MSYRILRLPEVIRRTGLPRSTIYKRIAMGTFVKQISLGGRAVGWLEYDVDEWIRIQIERSRGAANEQATGGSQPAMTPVDLSSAQGRRSAVDAYIAAVFDKTGKKITRADIWRAVGYKTKTEFDRWQRMDRKHSNATAAANFARFLRQKPHIG